MKHFGKKVKQEVEDIENRVRLKQGYTTTRVDEETTT